MQELPFEAMLELILARDSRYQRDAYLFVRDALDYTQKNLRRSSKGELRHVSGQELLTGIRHYALSQFGPMTITVFEEWGIRQCEDFGEIVFNMVDIGLLGKTAQDRREDFADGYDFATAFKHPFLPGNEAKVSVG